MQNSLLTSRYIPVLLSAKLRITGSQICLNISSNMPMTQLLQCCLGWSLDFFFDLTRGELPDSFQHPKKLEVKQKDFIKMVVASIVRANMREPSLNLTGWIKRLPLSLGYPMSQSVTDSLISLAHLFPFRARCCDYQSLGSWNTLSLFLWF